MGAPRKLRLPPGFYQNGTSYMAAGRYSSGDLVRWHGDAIEPIQGWARRYDDGANADMPPLWAASGEIARSGLSLGDGTAGVNTFIGTNKKIYFISNTSVKTDVTPTAFIPQGDDAAYSTGYGMYRYGFRQYGTARPAPQGQIPNTFSWSFAEWGFWPLAVARGISGSAVHVKRETDALFTPIAGSPEGAFDVVVTDERICMTTGRTTDYRLVEWSDQENFSTWIPTTQNQAGSMRLSGTGKLLRGVKVLNHILVLGENDAFSGQYVGPPYIYGFNRVGNRCGIVGPEAVAVTDTFAAWIGSYNFWVYDGTVRKLQCEVLDYFLKDVNEQQRSKINAFTIADFSEIWWLYQSKSSPTGDLDKYVVFNYSKNIWYTGSLSRTMGLDSDPLTNVLMVDPTGRIYDHELRSAGREGRVPFIETGPLEWADGQRLTSLSWVYPDEEVVGSVKMRLGVRDMPQMPERYFREFDLLSPTSTTGIMGRDIRMKLYGAGINQTWKIGDFRAVPATGGSTR